MTKRFVAKTAKPGERCRARVWDSGDMTDCGRAALPCGLCEPCRRERVRRLREVLTEFEPQVVDAKAELKFIGDYLEDPWRS